jgi:hypothetical protein
VAVQESRKSTRTVDGLCCQTHHCCAKIVISVINGNGQAHNININRFVGLNISGPVTAILYDKQGKETEVEGAIRFSDDGKLLNFNLSKFCHPDCPPEWKIAFVSGSKREEYIISNCNSWPPTAKKEVAKQN